jgi:hypothetical protein
LAKFVSQIVYGFGEFLGPLLMGAMSFCVIVPTTASLLAETDEF